MNKRDKEVIQHQLNDEKRVLSELRQQYQKALRDIEERIKLLQSDELTQSRIYQVNYQKALKAQVQAILEKLHADEYSTIQQYLSRSYTDGYVGAMYAMGGSGVQVIVPIDQKQAAKAIVTDSKLSYELYAALGHDMDKLKKRVQEEITRGIATALSYEQIAANLSMRADISLSSANRIVRTEAHRIQNAAAYDAMKAAAKKGADALRQWDASLDGATRPLHRQLDGQIRELDEPFEAGKYKIRYPGDFGDPSQDCNCRCALLPRARWALDEDELKTLKERAAYFGLDKTKDFADFRNKYLKAAKTVENTGKSGIIKVDKVISGHAGTPKKAEPGIRVIDHTYDNGTVSARGFYGADGLKQKDIHTDDHGFPKQHHFGQHGEHAHDYEWDENGRLKNKTQRELSEEERERNGDIL